MLSLFETQMIFGQMGTALSVWGESIMALPLWGY